MWRFTARSETNLMNNGRSSLWITRYSTLTAKVKTKNGHYLIIVQGPGKGRWPPVAAFTIFMRMKLHVHIPSTTEKFKTRVYHVCSIKAKTATGKYIRKETRHQREDQEIALCPEP